MKKLLLCFSFLGLTWTNNYAQSVAHHIIHNFSESELLNSSEVKHILTLEDNFIAIGNVELADGTKSVFIASYDYSATLLWKKIIDIPEGIESLYLNTRENLKKIKDNKYIIAGNAYKKIDDDKVSQPFVYIFNNKGEKIHYQQFNTATNIDINALNIDQKGNAIFVGVKKHIDLKYDPSSWDLTKEGLYPEMWIGMYKNDGTSFYNEVKGVHHLRTATNIRNVFESAGDMNYTIYGYSNMSDNQPIRKYEVTLNPTSTNIDLTGKLPTSILDKIINNHYSIYPLWDFDIQKSKYDDQYIYSYLQDESIDINKNKLMVKKQTASGILSTTVNDTKKDEEYFPYNNLLKIRESWNKETLLIKPMVSSPDSFLMRQYNPKDLYGYTIYSRLDVDGKEKENFSLQYFTHDVTKEIGQVLVDLDQRKDSKYIVLGGYIQANDIIEDKWDKKGKTSWIVILNDTSTTILPETPSGIEYQKNSQYTNIELYPNPTYDYININNADNSNIRNLKIYSIDGKLVLEQDNIQQAINIKSLNPGQYICKLSLTNGMTISKEFIKNN